MKLLLSISLLICAILLGLMMPELWLSWQDQSLETTQTIELSEPFLEWNPTKGTPAAELTAAELTAAELARRLTLFKTGPEVVLPVDTATKDDEQWATSCATEFLVLICEAQPEALFVEAEYRLAWFTDGTIVNFWTVYVHFNGDWLGVITIDEGSGAILQCSLSSDESDLAEMFPESFERAANESNTGFEDLVCQRFFDALRCFMEQGDGGLNPVISDWVGHNLTIGFEDDPDIAVSLFFIVDPNWGINFNIPGYYG